jgi:hypothetical protein
MGVEEAHTRRAQGSIQAAKRAFDAFCFISCSIWLEITSLSGCNQSNEQMLSVAQFPRKVHSSDDNDYFSIEILLLMNII